ncbi:MAG: hypothetical protein EWM47_04095 [Anaerolineaceae bacterium]|nr:MAG: hypothetical protein EWM47_04095 [Anaerolineaceae bacterium]
MFTNIMSKNNSEDNKQIVSLPEDVEIYAGNTLLLNPTSSVNANIKVLSMESVDTDIATINNSYIIANNVGETKINTRISVKDKVYELVTNVKVIPGKLSVEPKTKKISVGETFRYRAMVSNGVYKSVSYQSTDLKIAVVKKEGIYGYVTAIAEGKVDIIVTVNIGNIISESIISLTVEAAKGHAIPISNPVNGAGFTDEDEWKGSRVFFGRYEQDNNIGNGKEPILWRVLEVKDDTVFLLSEYGLLCKFYNDTYDSVTWETSTIRAWLNKDFLDKAFLKTEIDAILDTQIKTNNNKKYGSSGGNKTIDKVFLLSNKDVNNTAYGFQKGSRIKSRTRRVQITDHALVEGYRNKENMNTCWWLRSPGISNYYAAYVLTSGNVTYGHFVGRRNDAVRPAIKVKRSCIIFGEDFNDGKYKAPIIIAREK